MKKSFAELINEESTVVDSIVSIMAHTKKDDAKRLLTLVNTIVDYYMNIPAGDNKIKYPIIYLPQAPSWAREVLLEFLILKLSLCYNEDLRHILSSQFNKTICLSGDISKKECDYLLQCRRTLKEACKIRCSNFIGESGHKNIIFCNANDLTVSRTDKNKFIGEFYGNPDDVFIDKNLIMCHNLEANDVRAQLKEHRKEQQVSIDNAFLFFTNNDKSKSLELTALERWNDAYHVGLRNCFIFYFSNRPFSLRRIIERKKTLCKIFPMLTDKDAYSYKHFITFDQDEINQLFNIEVQQEHVYIKDDQLMFNDILGALIDEMDYKIQERNFFSLCMSEKLQELYQNHIQSYFPDYVHEDYQISFDWQYEVAKDIILPKIGAIITEHKRRNNSNRIALVVDKNVSREMKDALAKELQFFNDRLCVTYYDYSALKGDMNNKVNKIKETCVIILQYRPHYVKEPYYKYPNSFDPFITKEDQFIYDIIQGVAFDDMYQWDKYEYDKTKYELLDCDFRNDTLNKRSLPQRPSVKHSTGESDFSDERGASRSINYVKGTYEDGSRFSISEAELVLCELSDSVCLTKMSELINSNQISQIKKLQTLDNIEIEFKNYVAKKTDESDARERTFRDRYFANGTITKDEKDSGIALWKLILNKRIEQDGLETAYNLVMNGLKDHEKIQMGQFKRWADYNSNIILPLQKVCQRKLFEYLGFGLTSPYLSIMRSKKAATKNGTRAFNSMMYKFLSDTLLVDLTDEIYQEYANSDLNDLLNFSNYDEFELFVRILRDEINLKPIKTIS